MSEEKSVDCCIVPLTCSVPGCTKRQRRRGYCTTHYSRWLTKGDPLAPTRHYVKGTVAERFWPKVDKSGECWLWTGATSIKGYGIADGLDGRLNNAHRIAWELTNGPIPTGLTLDHTCHDPRVCRLGDRCPHRLCVNPAHLEPVTQKENVRRGALVVR